MTNPVQPAQKFRNITTSQTVGRTDLPESFVLTTLPTTSVIHPDAYIGQNIMVNSAPSAWKGILIGVEFHPAGFGVVLADGAMWTQADVAEIIRPGRKAEKKLPAHHGFVVHIPLCTAFQPAGYDGANAPQLRDSLPGDPGVITLAHYAEFAGKSEKVACEAIDKIINLGGSRGKGGAETYDMVDAVSQLTARYADEVRFPGRAVASMLAAEVLRRRW